MGALLGNLVFLQPWILAALAALPVLYVLLKITPPPPKIIRLPTARFLEGLKPDTQTPSKTPWWILLLRLLIAALVIFALARPVYNPASALPGSGPVRLIVDNSWAAAQVWSEEIQAAEEAIKSAGREGREIYIQTTAANPGGKLPERLGPFSEGQALSTLKGLKPYPWPADYGALAKALDAQDKDTHSIWFSHGLDENGFKALSAKLLDQGSLSVLSPPKERLPLLLKPADTHGNAVQVMIDAPNTITPDLPVSVQILGDKGRLLDQQNIMLSPDELPATLDFDIPDLLHSEITQFRMNGARGAGGTYILDERFKRRSVGIVGPSEDEDTKPFIEASYYLTRALEPFTTLHSGTVQDVLEQTPSVIILPDVGAMPAETLNALEEWVKGGGLLLRFAGPNMTAANAAQTFLTPTKLRSSARATEGTLAWDAAPKLAPFAEDSPFYGIDIHEDITVRQQILPDPAAAMDAQIWAALDDGTPLITSRYHDKGLLVMVHTTASPGWSDLALSGSYVEILKRLVSISGLPASQSEALDGSLQPVWVLDGFGARQSADSTVRPIPAAELEDMQPDAEHPPGIYGRGGFQIALNLGDHIKSLQAISGAPTSAQLKTYGVDYERDLMPYVLFAALILLLVDWLIMIIMISGLARLPRFAAVALVLMSFPAHANSLESDMKYAEGLYLAYIKTGNASVDAVSQKGLESLSAVLARRTSAEPVGVAALNPETDTLAFFPLIYWPVSEASQSLSEKALQNIQFYLDHGGTILFDTRDQNFASSSISGTPAGDNLRTMIGGLNIPPLQPINKDHVLSRSFYLLNEFPGKYSGGTLWVEGNSANGRDGVSSIIIGSHDWASAWAAGSGQRTSLSGGSRQQEMAYRFGVNMMMYALTGNYKADQVHVPHILERLGQ